MAQLQASLTDDRMFLVRPPPSRQHSSVEIGHEIFSTAILSFPELLYTYSGQLGYIEVNLFSTSRTFDDTYLLCSFTQKKGWIFYNLQYFTPEETTCMVYQSLLWTKIK